MAFKNEEFIKENSLEMVVDIVSLTIHPMSVFLPAAREMFFACSCTIQFYLLSTE